MKTANNLAYRLASRLSMRGADGKGSRAGVFIAVCGIALALIIMQFTVSVVSGFKNGIIDKLVGFDAKVIVEQAFDTETQRCVDFIHADADVIERITDVIPDADPVLSFRQPGILKTDNDFAGVVLQGYPADFDNVFARGNIVEGELPDYTSPEAENALIISRNMAGSLQLAVGDRPMCYFFIDDGIKVRRCDVAAIYESNFAEYDNMVVYSSLPMLQHLNGVDEKTGTRIELRNANLDSVEVLAATLQNRYITDYQTDALVDLYPVNNIKNTGMLYFNWLSLLDTNVVVIFILMLCVSGFTLVSSLFILILEHIPTIGILRAVGATKGFVRRVFISMAMKMVGWGLLAGNIVGIGLLLVQQKFKIAKLDPEMYYLRHVPVEIDWLWMLLLNVGVVVVAWLILVLPAHLASSISPGRTIRYE